MRDQKKTRGYAVLLAAALVGAALCFCPVHFLLDDDYALMQIVSGLRSGTPALYNVYNNILYSAPLSLLYRAAGNIPWYPLFEIAAIFAAVYAILFRTLRAAKEEKRALSCAAFFLAVFAAAFLPNLIFLQYSTAGAALGAAACVLLYTMRREDRVWPAVLFAAWSFLLRRETGFVTLAMLLAALLMRLLAKKAEDSPRPRAGIAVIMAFALCFGAFLAQRAAEQSEGIADFTAYNAARTAYMDYPHAGYDESGVYRELGWSRNFYDLTQRWFFLDARFNADSLEKINAATATAPAAFPARAKAAATTFYKTLFVTNTVRNLFLLMAGASFALALIRILKKDWRGQIRALIPFACLVGAGLLLSYIGRFPQHAFYALALPAVSLLAAEWAKLARGGLITRLAMLGTLLAALFIGTSSVRTVYALSHSEEYRTQEARAEAVDAFALETPDHIVVTDYSVRGAGTPFVTMQSARPLNRFFWGGWYCYSPFYFDQLEANGLPSLDAETFASGRALLLNSDEALLKLFTEYLTETCGPVRAERVVQTEYFTAWKFARAGE